MLRSINGGLTEQTALEAAEHASERREDVDADPDEVGAPAGTTRTRAKREPKPKAEVATKKARAKKASKPKAVAEAQRTVRQGVDGGDAIKAATRIVKAWKGVEKAKAAADDVRKAAADAVKSGAEAFREEIERGTTIQDAAASAEEQARDAQTRLGTVIRKWADWQDAIAGSSEERKGAKADVKLAQEKLSKAIEETRQLILFED